MLVFIKACTPGSEKAATDGKKFFKVYTLLINIPQKDNAGHIVTVTDTTVFSAATDSIAYLNATLQFKRVVAQQKATDSNLIVISSAFTILNEQRKNIGALLSTVQKEKIEDVARELSLKDNNSSSVKATKIQNRDTDHSQLPNTFDSIFPAKQIADTIKRNHRRHRSSTYIPI